MDTRPCHFRRGVNISMYKVTNLVPSVLRLAKEWALGTHAYRPWAQCSLEFRRAGLVGTGINLNVHVRFFIALVNHWARRSSFV